MRRLALLAILTFTLTGCDKPAPPSPSPSAPPTGLSGGTTGGESITTPEDRIALARKLLAEAGYPDGKGFPKLEILYNTDDAHKRIAAAIQQMWRKNLGIDVDLRNTEWKVYLDDQTKLRYQIVRRGWIGDYNDPNTFLELFTTHSGNNNTGWSNAEYDRLIKDAGAEPDSAKRFGILRKAEELLMKELPILPLYFYVTNNCWNEKVRGIHHTLKDIHPLKGAYVEGKDTLVINNATEVQTLDPTIARGQPEHRITIGLFENLLSYHPETLDPVPGVAERWEVSADKKKYTFHLRSCTWSDGKPVTAHDFVYGWTRILDPATPTDYAHLHYFIKGAEAFNLKKTSDPSTLGFRAIDDRTLEVELENPCHFFTSLIAFATYAPIRKDVVERHAERWTRPENFVGNGPYILKEWKPNDSITLEKNARYWDAAAVKSPFIKFLPIDNRSTAFNLYKEGAIDFATTLPLEQIDEIVKRPDYRGKPYLAAYFYGFNVTVPALKDRRIRKALALAVDREAITAKITRQGQIPAYSIVPPFWKDYQGARFDVKE